MNTSKSSALAVELRALIENFLSERREKKLKAASGDLNKQVKVRAQFQRETWLDDAARRAKNLKVVTHSIKPMHSDAKGTNLFAPPDTSRATPLIGSNVLGSDYDIDAVGGASVLDVFNFLQIRHDGSSLLDRVKTGDPALHSAFSDDLNASSRWIKAFTQITEASGEYASHTRAKQLYWLTGEKPTQNAAFHLLAPLYATSLAHLVFRTVNDDRFSDAAKTARKARFDEKSSEIGYCAYPNIAVQKLGGDHAQNTSQLNSNRKGVNYLFSSLPPTWQTSSVRAPLGVDTAFRAFGNRNEVRRLVRDLRRLLGSDPKPGMDLSDRRDELTEALIDALLVFSIEIQNLPAGWSMEPNCHIDAEQQFWLDPGRAVKDAEFREQRMASNWPCVVRDEFALWLNQRLSRPLLMSDTEHRAWAREVCTNMDFQRFVAADRDWMDKVASELGGLEGALGDE